MKRSVSIALLIFFGSVILLFLLMYALGDLTGVVSFGIVVLFLLSVIISLLVNIKETLTK